ncbi:hypothetical protein Nmel_009836 [Mimus melanotis]
MLVQLALESPSNTWYILKNPGINVQEGTELNNLDPVPRKRRERVDHHVQKHLHFLDV